MCLQTCFLLSKIRNQTPPRHVSVPYRGAEALEEAAPDGSPCISGAQVGSALLGLAFLLLGLLVPGARACCPWAGHVPSGTVCSEASRRFDASASPPVWIECFVWCCARERIHSSCEERCGRKQENICQDFSLPTAPHLIAGAGASPTFSFPLAPKLLKVETVIQNSNHVQIFKDSACSIQGWCLFYSTCLYFFSWQSCIIFNCLFCLFSNVRLVGW